MSREGTVEDTTDLQRDAQRVRTLSAADLDALPAAVQQVLIGVMIRANRERDAAARAAAENARDARSVERPAPDPAVLAAAEAGEPVAQAVFIDPETDEWTLARLSVRRAAEAGSLPRTPTAREYAAWSDEQIAALRLDPEEWIAGVARLDPFELDDEQLRDIPGMDEPMPEQHPFNLASERVEQAQEGLQRAEARRVQAALSAWRVAVESAVGTPDAAINSLFEYGVMSQIAHGLKIADRTAAALVHTAEELERDLPATWRSFTRGEIPWRAMQIAHARIDGLDPAFLAAFDAKAARILTTVPIPQAGQRLHELRERLQATTAVARHQQALKNQHVELENLPDGMAALTNVMPAAEAILAREAIHEQALAAFRQPGETRSVAQLESIIFTDHLVQGARSDAPQGVPGVLIRSRRAAIVKVGLLLPAMTAMGHSDVPAVLQGYGPIDIETAKRLAGAATSWVKVLTDPITGAVKDLGRTRYRPSADMRVLLGILDGGGRGPNQVVHASRAEADHVTPFRQHLARGRTAIDNLVPLAGRAHDLKTAGYLDITLDAGTRTLTWTDFAGNRSVTTVDVLEPTPVPDEFRSRSTAA